MDDVVLELRNLRIRGQAGKILVEGIDLIMRRGEPLVIIGETGSGKSLIAQALFGLLPTSLIASGQIRIDGSASIDIGNAKALKAFWGDRIFLIPQEPRLALDPTMRLGRQVAEHTVRGVSGLSDTWDAVDLPSDTVSYYPHTVSGGMAQRALVACAVHRDAEILVADEPTKALDQDRAERVVAILASMARQGRSILVITHDMDVVRDLGGQIAVLRDGVIVETGSSNEVLSNPQHDYTRAWLSAEPATSPRGLNHDHKRVSVVSASGLTFGYGRDRRLFENAHIDIARGEIVGLKGPSGTGKTTFGNLLLGLHKPSSGAVHWQGHDIDRRKEARTKLRQRYQKLHQDPASAFLPHRSLREQFADFRHVVPDWHLERLSPLLAQMKLGTHLLDRYPWEISGGEAQRMALARIVALDPDFLVADEPSSRLDPIVQKDVLALLRNLSRERGIGILLISHHQKVLEAVADRVIDIAELSD